MKVYTKKEQGILGLEENFASLEEINKNGYFVYKIKYKVDPSRAVQNKAYKVNIQVSKDPPTKKTKLSFTEIDPQIMLKNVLFRGSESKDLARSFQSNIIISVVSDITKRISNDQTLKLSKNSKVDPFVVKTKKEIKLAAVSELNDQNIVMPIFQTNLFKRSESTPPIVSAGLAKELAHNMIFSQGIDPANIGMKSNTIASSAKVHAGVSVKPANNNSVGVNGKTLIESILQKSLPVVATQFSLQTQDFIPVVVETPYTFIEIEETISIPIGSIEDEFHLTFELEDSAGLTVESINNSVSHSKLVAAKKVPIIPPTVKFMPSGKVGNTILLIKQEDPYAVGVNIYRKTMDKHSPQIDAQYTFLGKLDIKYGEDFKRVEDSHANFNPTIFRIVPFNDSGVLSSEFSSIVTKSEKLPPGIKAKKEIKSNFVSMAYKFEERGIDIEIKDIPPGPILLYLLRSDLSLYQKEPSIIGEPLLLNGRGSSPLILTDSSVKKNHIYEYFCKLIYRDGHTEIAPHKLTIEYLPVTNNVVETNLGKPVVLQEGGEIDVVFNMESNLIETNVDLIKRAMSEQGLYGIFQEDIIKNKEKLQNLLGYKVERTNLTTGEVEDFGILIDSKFSDKKFGKIKGVKPVQGGFEYRYSVSTYFRSPETLISTFTRTVETSTNLNYTFSPAKWLHPVTLSKGNIVTEKALATNHAKSDFSHGSVGNISTVNVSLANVLPSLYEGKASRLSNKYVLIQWKVQGELSKIDHFIVILEMLGMRKIVGKCHNISDANYFQFLDSLDEGEHGALTYHILPVFYDYSRGTDLSTNQVIV